MRGRIAGGVLWLALGLLPMSAQALVEETSGSWTRRCVAAAARCEVVQSLSAREGGTLLAQLTFGRPEAGGPLLLVVQLPTGVWLPAGVTLTAPGGPAVRAAFSRCLQLCTASAEVPDALLDALRRGTRPAVLRLQDGARRVIELPVALDGFTAATNGL